MIALSFCSQHCLFGPTVTSSTGAFHFFFSEFILNSHTYWSIMYSIAIFNGKSRTPNFPATFQVRSISASLLPRNYIIEYPSLTCCRCWKSTRITKQLKAVWTCNQVSSCQLTICSIFFADFNGSCCTLTQFFFFFSDLQLLLFFSLIIMCWSSNCDFVRFVASLSQQRERGGDIYTIIFRFRFRTELPIKASRGGYARSNSFRMQQYYQQKKIKKPKHLFALAKGERNATIVSTWGLGFKKQKKNRENEPKKNQKNNTIDCDPRNIVWNTPSR